MCKKAAGLTFLVLVLYESQVLVNNDNSTLSKYINLQMMFDYNNLCLYHRNFSLLRCLKIYNFKPFYL